MEALDVDGAFASDAVDAVVIASPNAHHAGHIQRAAVRGKAAPVASLRDGREALALADAATASARS